MKKEVKELNLSDLNKQGNKVSKDFTTSVDYAADSLKGKKVPTKIKVVLVIAAITQVIGITHSIKYIIQFVNYLIHL